MHGHAAMLAKVEDFAGDGWQKISMPNNNVLLRVAVQTSALCFNALDHGQKRITKAGIQGLLVKM